MMCRQSKVSKQHVIDTQDQEAESQHGKPGPKRTPSQEAEKQFRVVFGDGQWGC